MTGPYVRVGKSVKRIGKGAAKPELGTMPDNVTPFNKNVVPTLVTFQVDLDSIRRTYKNYASKEALADLGQSLVDAWTLLEDGEYVRFANPDGTETVVHLNENSQDTLRIKDKDKRKT